MGELSGQGALTVFLTLLYFYRLYGVDFIWETCLTLTRNGQKLELDLVIQHDQNLILIECKDRIENPAKLHDQIKNTHEIARQIGAELWFSTLESRTFDDFPVKVLARDQLIISY